MVKDKAPFMKGQMILYSNFFFLFIRKNKVDISYELSARPTMIADDDSNEISSLIFVEKS